MGWPLNRAPRPRSVSLSSAQMGSPVLLALEVVPVCPEQGLTEEYRSNLLALWNILNKPGASFQKRHVRSPNTCGRSFHTPWEVRKGRNSNERIASPFLPGLGHQAGGLHSPVIRLRFTEVESQGMLDLRLKFKYMPKETLRNP